MLKEFIKNQTAVSCIVLTGAAVGLIASIIFLINATTGWFAGQSVNIWIPLCSFTAIILAVCAVLFFDKITLIADLCVMLAVILLGLSVTLFIVDRIDIFSEVWLIPIPNPDTQIAAVNAAAAGIIFYFISIIALITASFSKKFIK